MTKLRMLALVPSALLLVAGLSACQGSGSSDERDSAATQAPADSPSPEATRQGEGDDASSGRLDPIQYFRTLQSIITRTNADLEAIAGDITNSDLTTDQEKIEGVQNALQRRGMILEQAILDIEVLQPPVDVQAHHDTFQAAILDVTVLNADLLQAIASVTTSAELNALLDQYDPQLAASDDAFDAACLTLQETALGSGVAVDLRCGN